MAAQFIPLDLASFQYSGLHPQFERSLQEPDFKVLNSHILESQPKPAIRELIEGWYGGQGFAACMTCFQHTRQRPQADVATTH
jgi:hypothetical protein